MARLETLDSGVSLDIPEFDDLDYRLQTKLLLIEHSENNS